MSTDSIDTEFLPRRLDLAETRETIGRIEASFDRRGLGRRAVEVLTAADFRWLRRIERARVRSRLTAGHREKEYATKGARAALAHRFETLGLPEIVSFTVPANVRPRAVVERLGTRRGPVDDFEHPLLPAGHPLHRHVLYRLAAPQT